jgi:excisionase family DNA binding protein
MIDKLLTTKAAASWLSCSERTLFTLTKSGALPCVRIGRAVRYNLADIWAWIHRNTKREVDFSSTVD